VPGVKCPNCRKDVPEGSRFCLNCGGVLSEASNATILDPGATTPISARTPRTPTPTPMSGSQQRRQVESSSQSSLNSSWSGGGRFVAGTVLAGRYRIVARLGRGGMGEVFRAEDLTLEQEVALKFLPPEIASDPAALERFHGEVRVARQVSHPNVCRVFDIGMADTAPFITMEYVDGEDLSTLIRRVGRFAPDKGLEISRQICAGLAAAHEQGLLHRDLKPANILLDGRGRVRIADFGLASIAGKVQASEISSGTPAYMAPEQLAGKEVTVKSDIYALGLVLYEIFTGKRAYEAATLAELQKTRETSAPASPTTLVRDLDPIIERVIFRCLERDPAKRPSSALQVAAALPGGDPLAAALAAGETPSPEMVAGAGTTEGWNPLYVAGCIAVVVIGMIIEFALVGQTRLHGVTDMPKSPDVLEARAQELLQSFGYTEKPAATAAGFDVDTQFLQWIDHNGGMPDRWHHVEDGTFYWYRTSRQDFNPRQIFSNYAIGHVSSSDPPHEDPGMVMIKVNPLGQLIDLRAVTQRIPVSPEMQKKPDWNALLVAAGFDPAKCASAAPTVTPPTYADAVAAWTADSLQVPGTKLQIEAATYAGRPVYFAEHGPWTPKPGVSFADRQQKIQIVFALIVIVPVTVIGALVAWRNLKKDRGDRTGAFKLAGFVFVAELVTWVIGTTHILGQWEAYNLTLELAWASLAALFMWMMYMALEPFVRRRMPTLLISWSRLMSGQWNDAMVGRDILAGAALALFTQAIGHLNIPFNAWRHWASPGVDAGATPMLIGGTVVFSQLVSLVNSALFNGLAILFLYVMFEWIFRNRFVAMAAFIGFWGLRGGFLGGTPFDAFLNAVGLIVFVKVLLQFGVLAIAVQVFVSNLIEAPITTHGAWYAWIGWLSVAVLAALLIFGAKAALAGQPLIKTAFADD
jgi:serine/threonine protein kinase